MCSLLLFGGRDGRMEPCVLCLSLPLSLEGYKGGSNSGCLIGGKQEVGKRNIIPCAPAYAS